MSETKRKSQKLSVKRSQIVRTNRPIERDGFTLPAGLRCNVMAATPDGGVKVTIRDPEYPNLSGTRVILPLSRLKQTFRGRPVTKETE